MKTLVASQLAYDIGIARGAQRSSTFACLTRSARNVSFAPQAGVATSARRFAPPTRSCLPSRAVRLLFQSDPFVWRHSDPRVTEFKDLAALLGPLASTRQPPRLKCENMFRKKGGNAPGREWDGQRSHKRFSAAGSRVSLASKVA